MGRHSHPAGAPNQGAQGRGWLATALIRAGTLASGTAILAAALATPAAAQPDAVPAAGEQREASAPATQVQQRDLSIVGLGDSFFTGLGAGAYQRPDARRQSQAAGFLQGLARLEAANPGLNITVQNHSSAGATIDDLYASQMAGGLLGQNMPINAPQLQGVDPNADVAIMGFGGNDVGFAGAIMRAFDDDWALPARVADLLAGQLDVSKPAAEYLADATRPRGQQQTLIGELIRGIQDAKAAMPKAKLVVTTYPEAVNPNATSPLSVISPQELAAFGQLSEHLNAAIRKAAELTGATVADNSKALAGHEVYTDDPYMHDLGPQWSKTDRDEAMHPNAAGQTAMADAVAEAVAKVTGLNPAAPHGGPDPYPTEGLTQVPRQPSRPSRTLPPVAPNVPAQPRPLPGTPQRPELRPSAPSRDGNDETPKPDKINWTGDLPRPHTPGNTPVPDSTDHPPANHNQNGTGPDNTAPADRSTHPGPARNSGIANQSDAQAATEEKGRTAKPGAKTGDRTSPDPTPRFDPPSGDPPTTGKEDRVRPGQGTEPAQPAPQKPAPQKPAPQKPAPQKPAAQKPAAQKPAAQKPAAQKPAAQKPATKGQSRPAPKPPGFEPIKWKPGVGERGGSDAGDSRDSDSGSGSVGGASSTGSSSSMGSSGSGSSGGSSRGSSSRSAGSSASGSNGAAGGTTGNGSSSASGGSSGSSSGGSTSNDRSGAGGSAGGSSSSGGGISTGGSAGSLGNSGGNGNSTGSSGGTNHDSYGNGGYGYEGNDGYTDTSVDGPDNGPTRGAGGDESGTGECVCM